MKYNTKPKCKTKCKNQMQKPNAKPNAKPKIKNKFFCFLFLLLSFKYFFKSEDCICECGVHGAVEHLIALRIVHDDV